METHNYYHENEADRILAAIVRDERPHYRSAAIVRKRRVDRRRAKEIEANHPALNEASTLLQRHAILRVVASANLTATQRRVLDAKLSGEGWLDIGLRFGHTKQGAQRIFYQALGKVRRAWRACPFAGLHEVYREEVRRYAPRRH